MFTIVYEMHSLSCLSQVSNQILHVLIIRLITRAAAIYTASLVCMIILSCVGNAALFVLLDPVSIILLCLSTYTYRSSDAPTYSMNM